MLKLQYMNNAIMCYYIEINNLMCLLRNAMYSNIYMLTHTCAAPAMVIHDMTCRFVASLPLYLWIGGVVLEDVNAGTC